MLASVEGKHKQVCVIAIKLHIERLQTGCNGGTSSSAQQQSRAWIKAQCFTAGRCAKAIQGYRTRIAAINGKQSRPHGGAGPGQAK